LSHVSSQAQLFIRASFSCLTSMKNKERNFHLN
jgi:hypothetical protein